MACWDQVHFGDRPYGETLHLLKKGFQPRPLPWQKKQVVVVTAATKPGRLSDGNLGNPKKDTMLIHGTFMHALGSAQSRFPGRELQIKTIDTTPAWLKEMRDNAKLAESQFETAIEGQES